MTYRPTRNRTTASLLITLVMAASLLFSFTPVAEAQPQTATIVRATHLDAAFVNALNVQRAARGIRPLQPMGSMNQAAANWSSYMTSRSILAHSSRISSGVPAGWRVVGENVGRGRSVASLTAAFMASPSHRANVLNPRFNYVGVGTYIHPTGRVYTTHRFAQL